MTTFTTEDRLNVEQLYREAERLADALELPITGKYILTDDIKKASSVIRQLIKQVSYGGWMTADAEDRTQMLRDQLQAQQKEIDRLNGEIFKLQILANKRYVYDPDGGGNDVWVIEKKKANEF